MISIYDDLQYYSLNERVIVYGLMHKCSIYDDLQYYSLNERDIYKCSICDDLLDYGLNERVIVYGLMYKCSIYDDMQYHSLNERVTVYGLVHKWSLQAMHLCRREYLQTRKSTRSQLQDTNHHLSIQCVALNW